MAAIALGLLLIGPAARAESAELFGLATVAVADGALPATWRKLQTEIQSDERIVVQCRAEPQSCAWPAALRFIAIVGEGNGYDGLARIGRINRAVNLAIGAANAVAVQSAWSSPLQTLAVGSGDCKQYAVLKYAALQDAGIAADDLRLVIVRIKRPQNPGVKPTGHALVAVRNDADWIVLDNRSLAMIESRQVLDQYLPLFVLDHRGVRRFVQPSGADAVLAPCGGNGG
ncbi:MAG: transglutaminase-like cysteine peptidase [Pseudolabrys sp.]|nr:transglutaminase-like cysteine peptidase [Pseudolabrys sp.]